MDDTPAVMTTIIHLPWPVITGVRVTVVSVPLPRPVSWSNVSVSSREYVLVWIDADDGQTGFGFTLGSRFGNGGVYIASAITDLLEPLLIGRVAFDIERLWEDMAFQTLLLGRRGAVMRAISAVDIALWDLLAISAGRPLCDLLGQYRSTVPAYASGGYYYSETFVRPCRARREVRRHVDLGFRAVKIKTGRLSARRDRERIIRVLEAVGPDVRVAVDANHAWRDYPSAINDLRHLDDLGLWWIEEPVLPDHLDGAPPCRHLDYAGGDRRDRGRTVGLSTDRGHEGRRYPSAQMPPSSEASVSG